MSFINKKFMLTNETAARLYHDSAADQPIIDYHNHLSPKDIAENRRYANLYDMWIDSDHYKWRAMRANGVDESLVTGDADPKEKFLAFARTVPFTLRNPLYHWTHLELKRFFDIDELLDESNAESIWERCNDQIQSRKELSTQGILKRFQVTALCTTDDPADDLPYHRQLADSESEGENGFETSVYPCFRPDWAMFVHRPDEFNEWLSRLESVSDQSISKLADLESALAKRHDDFHALGCRLSDHGMEYVPDDFCTEETASRIFDAARSGKQANPEEHSQFSTYMLLKLARMDAAKGWTNQFHTGVWRNNNTRLFNSVGRDIGCDSMADTSQGRSLQRFLDRLDQDDALPETIVYNLNPGDNYLISTMLGNFQGGVPGKMQFDSGW